MSTKRVILANGSRLLRELLRRVISKADHLEVVQEIGDQADLPSAIERFEPEWVILSLPPESHEPEGMPAYAAEYPSVRFILISFDNRRITMRWQASVEEDLTNLSVRDFIHILEKDLQHT